MSAFYQQSICSTESIMIILMHSPPYKKRRIFSFSFGHRHQLWKRTFAIVTAQSSRSSSTYMYIYICLSEYVGGKMRKQFVRELAIAKGRKEWRRGHQDVACLSDMRLRQSILLCNRLTDLSYIHQKNNKCMKGNVRQQRQQRCFYM